MNAYEQPQQNPTRRIRTGFLWKVFCVLFLISFIASFAGAIHYRRLYSEIANSSQSILSKEDTIILVKEVSKLIDLPQDEIPTVAEVANPDSLKDQKFFAKAKKGDKVLIYRKAGKAILYRQSENKIIEMAPLSLGGSTVDSVSNSEGSNVIIPGGN